MATLPKSAAGMGVNNRIAQSLLPEFEQEMAGVRKTLERVPDDKFDYKPHPKSGSLGWLAGHLANLPSWTVFTLQQDSLDLAPAGGQQFKFPRRRTANSCWTSSTKTLPTRARH